MIKKQVSKLYVEQLEELWEMVVAENIGMLEPGVDGVVDENTLNDIKAFKEAMFSGMVGKLEVIAPVPPPLEMPTAASITPMAPVIPPSTASKVHLSVIKSFEQEHVDQSLLNRLEQLKVELTQSIKSVEQLRRDVPSIVSTEVTQNLKKSVPAIIPVVQPLAPVLLQFTPEMTADQSRAMLEQIGYDVETIKSESNELLSMLVNEVTHSKEVIEAVSHIISTSEPDY
ncbi:hypothetical protein PPL_01911 [Heterostelium album PN500]|uniref:Uncharacterized protein n=1 Tax=Heterostelium pallidum (strain ATCC 26659 / Pp 5 / PN500) TaxID=670386 RepID=D3B0U4_HETP5|nr:hypothetical protein PPL_01911 [Heterostelium album PN500]EFA84918.1 hypothetical protein PPL_01911 [Heterostelium album PN500]|eukprot:XP_020437028.1 hypothetical protein PPL_01911 [Heterostelium album PN500]